MRLFVMVFLAVLVVFAAAGCASMGLFGRTKEAQKTFRPKKLKAWRYHCRSCGSTFYIVADNAGDGAQCPYCGWSHYLEVQQKEYRAWELQCRDHGTVIIVCPDDSVGKGEVGYCPFGGDFR